MNVNNLKLHSHCFISNAVDWSPTKERTKKGSLSKYFWPPLFCTVFNVVITVVIDLSNIFIYTEKSQFLD